MLIDSVRFEPAKKVRADISNIKEDKEQSSVWVEICF